MYGRGARDVARPPVAGNAFAAAGNEQEAAPIGILEQRRVELRHVLQALDATRLQAGGEEGQADVRIADEESDVIEHAVTIPEDAPRRVSNGGRGV